MDINRIIAKIRNHPESERIGMIATHLGIVRGNSRNGREVSGIEVVCNHEILNDIINETKSLPGIVDVIAEFNEGALKIGDIIMFVAIGGDVRDNVFPALSKTVERIKKDGSRKKEFFV
ncbi:MAG: molybdenum cofactor biosynthesis protein MoaE [Deltaproteobacteria bacterium]|nr:molybdenum cofactor biosynthesis protein MoaE [Deltaproteobacteria bacterium]